MMAKTEKHQCEKKVRKGATWHRYDADCPNAGIVERDGKWYCGQHDPVKVKEREDSRQAKWTIKWDEEKERTRRQYAERHYCQKLTTEYLEQHQAEVPPFDGEDGSIGTPNIVSVSSSASANIFGSWVEVDGEDGE